MHSVIVPRANLHLIRTAPSYAKPSWRAQAGDSRKQVAAVCYRVRKLRIEFLLVRTRKGRWTFPKGGVIPGLTYAQSAALEAFEEAGVHGRIEQTSFTRYTLHKRGSSSATAIHAHLCEVLRLAVPQEPNRDPTWFSAERTQSCLRERRSSADARELAAVVDRAVARIQRLGAKNGVTVDPLQRVQFEASEASANSVVAPATLVAYVRRSQRKTAHPPVLEFDAGSRKIVRIGPAPRIERLPR